MSTRDRVAPSDVKAGEVWDRIMGMASEACLIVQAAGGVATLAMPEDQRSAGIRVRVLAMECARENAENAQNVGTPAADADNLSLFDATEVPR